MAIAITMMMMFQTHKSVETNTAMMKKIQEAFPTYHLVLKNSGKKVQEAVQETVTGIGTEIGIVEMVETVETVVAVLTREEVVVVAAVMEVVVEEAESTEVEEGTTTIHIADRK